MHSIFQNVFKKCTCNLNSNEPELVQEKGPPKKLSSRKKLKKKEPSELFLLKGHTERVSSVSFHPQDDKIVSGSDDKTIRIWDVRNGNQIAKFQNKERISSIGFLFGGEKIVCGSIIGLSIWDLNKEKEVSKTKNHSDHLQISSIAISKKEKGNKIISGSWGQEGKNCIRLWDSNLKEIKKFEDNKWVNSLDFSHQEDKIVSGGSDKTIRLWNLYSGKLLKKNIGYSYVNSTKFSKKGDIILSGGVEGTIKLWNIINEEEIKIKAHRFSINSVIFSPQEDVILSGSKDNTIKLWETQTGREIKTYEGHEGDIYSICFNHKGDKIVSGSQDCTIRIWNVQ